ncbi:MAG: hypothetical protein Q7R66_08490 [Undibacterium sp.]|uniref:hypothetical protein n=1 Tax=Undibacterium sp. TaxID=1914977 RepID=UPI00271C9C7B|nr:hypothetical protein [Undibacterium sp.]MDO8652212.1 hypothetical protein [Undibacterium sp.]
MAILYKKNIATFEGVVSVEEAEDLLQWSQKNPKGRADFTKCTHIHAADLQVLMAARMSIAAWPQDDNLKTWLKVALVS